MKFKTKKEAMAANYYLDNTPKGIAWFKSIDDIQITQPFDLLEVNTEEKQIERLNAALAHKAAPEQPKPVYAFPGQTMQDFQDGMELRDWFAGGALSGIIEASFQMSNTVPEMEDISKEEFAKGVAMWTFDIADAMMAERARRLGEKDTVKENLIRLLKQHMDEVHDAFITLQHTGWPMSDELVKRLNDLDSEAQSAIAAAEKEVGNE